MTKQKSPNLRTIENENSLSVNTDNRHNGSKNDEQKNNHKKVHVNGMHDIEEGNGGLEEKIPRNAFLKLDLDAIALRMRKDLADRCCCADVPCVSTIKEYCESR